MFVHADGSGGFVFRKGKPLKWQKPNKDAFQGNVYILIDGYSFSVTSEFAAIAHNNKRATFIGRETGGGYLGNTSGFFVVSVLPNSGVEVATPQWDYWMSVENPIKDRGIMPDIEIWPTAKDVLDGRNLEMERVMNVIN
ncbi:S41 family peptidase [Flavobacterium selenitireducens]|uniref:S41 family peptidase n=1 Tax=Flavobacterium selenitireducens TaxID=2722704 RepID=UPI00168BEAAC|nr:S41 family peptidase [Flavobacterium selenitireducens]MBD3581716.1 hypothetical protein [Flavobacterium selenitireducens]